MRISKILLLFVLLTIVGVHLGCGGGGGQSARWVNPLFIINGLGETLSVYDLASATIHRDVTTTGKYPNFMVLRGNLGYVVNSGDNNIQIFNLNDLSLAGTIDVGVGNNPMQIAFVNDQKAYVSNLFTDSVSVVDVAARQVVATIPVGKGPTPVTATGEKVFVANTNIDYTTSPPTYNQGTVSVINPATNKVTNTIPVGTNPQAMAVDALGRVHVVCTGDYSSIPGEVYIIDASTLQVVGNPIALGGAPGSISIGPTDGIAYLVSTSFSDPTLRGLMAYNSQTGTILQSASNLVHIGTNPFAGLAVSDGSVYVADFSEDSLYRYQPQSGQITNLGPVGDGPQFLAAP